MTRAYLGQSIPAIIVDAGAVAVSGYNTFFTERIENPHTREAYRLAVSHFFAWSAKRRMQLNQIGSAETRAYVESVRQQWSASSIKVRLAGIKAMFAWLMQVGVLRTNPAQGVTVTVASAGIRRAPLLTPIEVRRLFASIDVTTVSGMRDRALLGVMLYTFSSVSVTLALDLADCRVRGSGGTISLAAEGQQRRDVPLHRRAAHFLLEYLGSIRGRRQSNAPLFRTISGRTGSLTNNRMTRVDALRMIKRRASAARLPTTISCRTFQGTGIATYLANGGAVSTAKKIAGRTSGVSILRFENSKHALSIRDINRIAV